MSTSEQLHQAIQSARAGDHRLARRLLRELLADDPQNEMAWLWMSEVAPDMDERISALENAVRINPLNSRAQESLHYLRVNRAQIEKRQAIQKDQKIAQARKWLKEAKIAYDEGRRKDSLDLLLRYVEVDDQEKTVWLLLSELAPGLEDKIVALENVLTLDPGHKEAKLRINKLRHVPDDLLARGVLYEKINDLENAINLYIEASVQAQTSSKRLEALRRLEMAQIKLNKPSYRATPALVTFIRLAAGPILLYSILLLVHSGFNLQHASPLLCLANFSVMLGSAMLVLTSAAPVVHIWYTWWQKLGGESEEIARRSFLFLGLLLILFPFLLLLLDSLARA